MHSLLFRGYLYYSKIPPKGKSSPAFPTENAAYPPLLFKDFMPSEAKKGINTSEIARTAARDDARLPESIHTATPLLRFAAANPFRI